MKQFKNVLSVRLFGVAAIALAIVTSLAVMPLTGCTNPTDPGSNGKTLVSIAVTISPTKDTHNIGEDLDKADIVVTATYSDGTTAVVTGYKISGYDKTKPGNQTVTVTYQGKTATFDVTVIDPSKETATKPTASPEAGAVASGSTVTLTTTTADAEIWYTTDGSIPAKNGETSTKYASPIAITAAVTIKAVAVKDDMNDSPVLEAAYTIETAGEKTLVSIAVTPPTKTEYYTGETLNTAGMVVTATYSDDTTAAVTGYATSGFNSTTAGSQTITVTYQGKTATFTVTVSARPIVATPTANPPAGLVASGTTIALATTTDGAEIWYTSNGSAPAKSGTGSTKYTAPFAITTLPTTVKAIAVKDEWTNSGVLEAVYGSAHITVADISITAPAKGATPADKVFNQPQERFTEGTVTWDPNDSKFKGSTEYTATVTLTAKQGFTFTGFAAANAKVNGNDATTVTLNNTGSTLTLTYKFAATDDKVVSAIAIKSQPTNLIYQHGELLDLDGLVVTLTYDDGTTEDVAAADFGDRIATDPGHGVALEHSSYNGEPVTITFGDLAPQSTNVLTVSAIDVSALTVSDIADETYTGDEITPSFTVQYTVETGTSRDLVLDTDYTAEYKDNVNAGTATVTITGIKDYSGTKDVKFTINKADPVTVWPTASSIEYGKKLSDSVLGSGQAAAGTFAWDAPDTVPEIGTSAYKVTFTPGDTANYNTVSNEVKITVNAIPITVADISITAPAKAATPSTAVTNEEQERFTSGTVTWIPSDNTFEGGKIYTATVTLTAKTSFTFTGITGANVKVNGQAATITNNTGERITVSYGFTKTPDKVVSSITIKSPPTKLTYTHGDALDLTGLVVTLNYDDSTKEDVAAANFTAKSITTAPANGIPLERATADGKPVTITYGNLTPLSTNNLTVNQGNASTFTIEPASIAAQPYTGTAITPAIAVKYPVSSGTARNLTSGTDYEAAYTNNTNAGTAAITITGKGEYTGTKTVNFTINPKPVSETGVTVSPIAAQTYSGSEIKPTVTVSFGSGTLASGTDYTAAYTNNTNTGTATVTITGKGNFSGTTTVQFTINKANPAITWTSVTVPQITYGQKLSASTPTGGTTVPGTYTWDAPDTTPSINSGIQYDVTFTPTDTANYNVVKGKLSIIVNKINLSSFTVELTITDYQYTGSAITPAVTVKDSENKPLSQTTDFTVSCTNNTNVGQATLTITGAGNYTGSITGKTFNIIKANPVTTWPTAAAITYGEALSTSSLTGGVYITPGTFAWTTGATIPTVSNSGYSVTFTPTDTGNYNTVTGTVSITVNPKNASTLTIDAIAAQTYTGSEIKPAVTVKDGATTLTKDTDYTVGYTGNTNAGTNTATVTITGVGNYTGTTTANFTISPKNASGLTIDAITAQTYTGSEIKPTVTVKDGAKTLTLTTDYTAAYTSNTNVGTATVTITGAGNYTGTKTANFTIDRKSVSDLTVNPVSISDVFYTGSAITPAITSVTYGTIQLTPTTDYTVGYSNNTNVGTNTATVTITGVGNYTGTKNLTFSIKTITYSVEQIGGAAGSATTTGIRFTFAASIDSLGIISAADITVSGSATKAATAAFSGSGTTWTLSPVTVSSTGNVTVSINNKTGVESGNKTVAVYYATGTATISVTFAQITDAAGSISVSIPDLHRVSGTSTQTLILSNAAQYDANSISWEVNGTEIGTGDTVILKAAHPANNTFGKHYLTINVKKDGVPYSKTVSFNVVY